MKKKVVDAGNAGKFDQLTPKQLKQLSETNEKINASIVAYVEEFLVLSHARINNISLERVKRALLLGFEFGLCSRLIPDIREIFTRFPALISAVLLSEDITLTNLDSGQPFTATYDLKLSHLIAYFGDKYMYKSLLSHLLNDSSRGDTQHARWRKAAEILSEPAIWRTTHLNGISGFTPLFLAIAKGKANIIECFVSDCVKLIPNQGFDLPPLNLINPFLLALRLEEYKNTRTTSGLCDPFVHLLKLDGNRSLISDVLQYSVDQALQGNLHLLRRLARTHPPIDLYVSQDYHPYDIDLQHPLSRAANSGNLEVVKLITHSVHPLWHHDVESLPLYIVAKRALSGDLETYLPTFKFLLGSQFLLNHQHKAFYQLLEESSLAKFSTLFSIQKNATPKSKLKCLLQAAKHVQDAITFIARRSKFKHCNKLAHNFNPFLALKEAAKLDIDFFNQLVLSHIAQKDVPQQNSYLVDPLDIVSYFELLIQLADLEKPILYPSTLNIIAEGVLYFHEKDDSLSEINWAEDLYRKILKSSHGNNELSQRVQRKLDNLMEKLDLLTSSSDSQSSL